MYSENLPLFSVVLRQKLNDSYIHPLPESIYYPSSEVAQLHLVFVTPFICGVSKWYNLGFKVKLLVKTTWGAETCYKNVVPETVYVLSFMSFLQFTINLFFNLSFMSNSVLKLHNSYCQTWELANFCSFLFIIVNSFTW